MDQRPDATPDAAPPQSPTVRLSRIFPARRETVFAAWSTAAHVSRWFAPEGCDVTEAAVELRVGGRFELCMRSPVGAHWLRGTFIEVSPPDRLVIDMRISETDGNALFAALTEVDFADAPGGGTRMDVTQTYTIIDPSKAWMVAGAPQGWRSTLDNLAREVARMEA
jgi:uncharacterized protein YndB with AHSA1/START domain